MTMTTTGSPRKNVFALGVVLVLSTTIVGCTNQYNPSNRAAEIESTYPNKRIMTSADRNGTTLSQHNNQMRTENRDTIMGRNANPNLVIGHSDVNNRSADVRNMEMMAKSVSGVEQAKITISGANAYVSLDLLPNVTAEQARAIETQVIQALYQKVPRYDFHMTSNDGYHR